MVKKPINKSNQIEPRRGGKLLLELLESEGVEYVFGNPGTTELPFIDALIDSPIIKYIWGLQEASVVAMADGYAQASGRPGFVNLHTAGGLGHGLGNLLNASVSGTPLVVTAGQQDSRHSITDPLLFGDLVQSFSTIRPMNRSICWKSTPGHRSRTPTSFPRFTVIPSFNYCWRSPWGCARDH